VSDAGLEKIAQLTDLQFLGLSGTKVTDAGMQALQHCLNLRELHLAGTAIGDDGLKSLAELQSLKVLALGDTLITDSGLEQLARLEMLVDLDISGTQITKAAEDKLQAARPNLAIKPPKPVVKESPVVSPLIGTTSENWTTTDLAGKKHSLEDYRGNVVILDFWFRKCTYCLRAMPQVNQVAQYFENQPVVVIGMSTDEKAEEAAAVVEKMGLKYPVLKAREISETYQIEGFPTLLIIDQKGGIRKVHTGYSSTLRDDIIEAVEALLKRE
jgi:peroxiredoxin